LIPVAKGNPTDASGAFRSGPRAPTEAGTPFFQNFKLMHDFEKSRENNGLVKSSSAEAGQGAQELRSEAHLQGALQR
jgi:hypothetical protein